MNKAPAHSTSSSALLEKAKMGPIQILRDRLDAIKAMKIENDDIVLYFKTAGLCLNFTDGDLQKPYPCAFEKAMVRKNGVARFPFGRGQYKNGAGELAYPYFSTLVQRLQIEALENAIKVLEDLPNLTQEG